MKAADAHFKDDFHKMVLFVEQTDGTYNAVQTGSYMTENYLDDFFKKRAHFEAVASTRLKSGEISPVAYYMELLAMTPADVAARVRIPIGAVKKQMTPEGFKTMNLMVAKRYAEVFGIPLANLFQIVIQPPKPSSIKHTATAHPFVVVTAYHQEQS
jgi:hypothetical protein